MTCTGISWKKGKTEACTASHALRFDFEGEPVDDEREFRVGMEHYHFMNMPDSFDLKREEVMKHHRDRIVATSCIQIIEELLEEGKYRDAKVSGRLIIHLRRRRNHKR